MAIKSLSRVVDASFFTRVASIAQTNQNSAASLRAAISGGGASTETLSSSLNLGSRLYTNAARSLNQAVAAIQVSKDSLEKLGEVSGRLVEILSRAEKPTISTQERNNIDSEFRELGREFQKIVEEAKLGDQEIFQSEGISEVLTVVGLSPEQSETIGAIFDDLLFSGRDSDLKLASEEIRGARPISKPTVDDETLAATKVRIGQVRDLESVFSSGRSLRVLSDVAVLKEDIGALDNQIKQNLETLGSLEGALIENYGLARAVAISMQDLQEEVNGSTQAQELASMLRDSIRKNADSAMRAQAGNLDQLAIAAYALLQSQEDS